MTCENTARLELLQVVCWASNLFCDWDLCVVCGPWNFYRLLIQHDMVCPNPGELSGQIFAFFVFFCLMAEPEFNLHGVNSGPGVSAGPKVYFVSFRSRIFQIIFANGKSIVVLTS